MDRITTFGRGSDVPGATLNALQNLSFGLRKGSGSVAGAAARQGATVCTWASADAGVADETVAVVDATAGVDWRGRVLWGWLIRLESAAQRAHGASAWQANDPTRPTAVRVFGGRASTGTGGLRAGAALAVADGYPPSIEAGSFAVVVDEGATVADRVWLYARSTDGALCLYNASGGALHAELMVFGAAVPPDPSAPPPALIPTLTEVQWLDPDVAADRPADPGGPALFRATDTGVLSLWDGGAWRVVGGGAPAAHAASHAELGSDPIAPEDIGAMAVTDLNKPVHGLDMDGNRIEHVDDPVASDDAATKGYVDTAVGAASAGSIGHRWERPSPTAAGPGAVFVDTDELTEQVSSGLAASAGVAASGWMQRLPSGLGAGRAAFSSLVAPTSPARRVYAESLDLDAYTIGAVTLAVLYTWDGTQPASYGFSEVATLGQRDNASRGVHVAYSTNGANTDLRVYSGGSATVLVASANLLAGAAGLHCLTIAAVDVSGTHKWRFSYDGSAVTDVTMAANYVAPSSSDSICLGARTDGIVWLNGTAIELAVWNSLLSNANILDLATLPGTPTYEIPESAATGPAAIRVQASRYDPIGSPTTMRARGLSTALTVAGGTTKVTL